MLVVAPYATMRLRSVIFAVTLSDSPLCLSHLHKPAWSNAGHTGDSRKALACTRRTNYAGTMFRGAGYSSRQALLGGAHPRLTPERWPDRGALGSAGRPRDDPADRRGDLIVSAREPLSAIPVQHPTSAARVRTGRRLATASSARCSSSRAGDRGRDNGERG
jgi:hypothetical protein